ncbi:uncharacterized protein LOC113745337 [Larimichthys crocea]|uniref:uncharacterized protein LOC113745337 n=1 Tax=Larimichthys crocea TaxID=215358 RepID=UPI000F5E99D3|nr:uncharacterized protein LOC113745337 [Larimichthys crocea]
MRVDRIARIFQINMDSLYITDAANVAIFPVESGCFSSLDLSNHGHYEVHGEVGDTAGTPRAPAAAPSPQFAFRNSQPVTTANMSLMSRSVTTPRSFQRSIHVSEVMDGKLVPTRVVVVRFVEAEASVSVILEKLKVAMGDDEDYIFTDTLGNEIVESEGTSGSLYWRQNARKTYAIESTAFRQWRRQRRSRKDAVQMLKDQVEELLDASQGLDEVTKRY